MSKINNKFPGKDISLDDLRNKFPLTVKKNANDGIVVTNTKIAI